MLTCAEDRRSPEDPSYTGATWHTARSEALSPGEKSMPVIPVPQAAPATLCSPSTRHKSPSCISSWSSASCVSACTQNTGAISVCTHAACKLGRAYKGCKQAQNPPPALRRGEHAARGVQDPAGGTCCWKRFPQSWHTTINSLQPGQHSLPEGSVPSSLLHLVLFHPRCPQFTHFSCLLCPLIPGQA